jgi:serine protease Do
MVYVLTNNHVVGEADTIVVSLHDKRQFNATLVGRDPRKDLALVEIETEEDLPLCVLGNSDSVQVGDIVFAVGNPHGYQSTITSGIISAVGRRPDAGTGVAGYTDYIQTDAPINRGSSGGPLVNIRGEVIGINTWIASPSGGSIGLGFTIPINHAKQTIEELIAKGSVDYGWLGINIADPIEDLRRDMKIEGLKGGFVFDVFKGSPAEKEGILPGDFITSINDSTIDNTKSLIITVGELPVGEIAEFDVIRYGKPLRIDVRITARKDEKTLREMRKNLWPGMAVVGITPDIQEQLNLSKKMGDLVIGNVSSDGPSGVAGLRPGDVIRSINDKSVKSVIEFYRVINEQNANELVFRIYRQGNELIIGLLK